MREALKITDRSYLIKDGKVRAHGTPQQIVHDPIAISEYLGTSFNDGSIAGPAPGPRGGAETDVRGVLEQERLRRLIERLKTDDPGAAAELRQRGAAAVPVLLEALERRDVELRRQACLVLQGVLNGAVTFDPFAPEAQRRQQIAELRARHERKAS